MTQKEQQKLTDGAYLFVSLLSGAAAGISVDISLFPLDTLKTRLQSQEGVWKSGGLRNIYAGLAPVAIGSAPNAAIFFVTYDAVKLAVSHLHRNGLNLSENDPTVHMLAASLGEVTSCLIQVPVEIVKQRRQAGYTTYNSSQAVIKQIWNLEGLKGFYRGYSTTVIREIPLCMIQFPIWERLKVVWKKQQMKDVEAWQSAICGAVAGGFSAGKYHLWPVYPHHYKFDLLPYILFD